MTSVFFLSKMKHYGQPKLVYTIGDLTISSFVGKQISITHTGCKQCVACQRSIKKTVGEGYCFPCFQKLARCDLCIVRPERCHYHLGTCREPDWGQEHCRIPHLVYLSNTSGLKVGITRLHKRLERWGDQGAIQALGLCLVSERLHAGLVEQHISAELNDKTDWRALITGKMVAIDLVSVADGIRSDLPTDLCQPLPPELEGKVFDFEYPVLHYPEKAKVWNLDKTPRIAGVLHGIKGQYLFIDGQAINIRKYSGYEVEISF
jgi:hypothetical protein